MKLSSRNFIFEEKVTFLRMPMTVPKWAVVSPICLPLGLAYVAASVRRAGFQIRCVDSIGEAPFQHIAMENPNFLSYGLSTSEIIERVGKCTIIGVSLMFSHDWPLSKSIIQAIRLNNPNALIICGGEHINAAPEFCLNDCPEFDICVLGEGEETIVDLLSAVREDRDLKNVNGIVFRSNTQLIRTLPRKRIKCLEDIPWPAWDIFPMENYLGNGLGYGVSGGRTIPILASRGCPFECTFCSSPQMWTTKWQARATADVIEEMQYYIDHYKAQNFDLYDLTAILRKEWVMDFCQKIIDKNWKITWQMPSGTRSEALDAEALRFMHLSGQKNISYAPESGSVTTLKKIKKQVNLPRMKESMRAAVKEGINTKLNMIMGFPHETRKEIFETFRFLIEVAIIGVHDVYISCFSPYPGSEIFNDLVKAGKIKELDSDYFLMLTGYTDLRYSYSYSPHLSNRELTIYRIGGMMLFYSCSFLMHPTRLFRLVYNLARGAEESRLELALGDMKGRLFSKKVQIKNNQLQA